MLYLLEFFIFAFLGWIVDSTYCSIEEKKFVSSGYFPGIPMCPIYGFGGILLMNTFAISYLQPAWITIVIATLMVIALEYVGGWLCEHLLDEKLWNYSNEFLNLNGYISLWHSFLWLIAVATAYWLIGAKSADLLAWLETKVAVEQHSQVFIYMFLLMGIFWLTVKTKKLRLAKLAQKEIKSLEQMFDLKKWHFLTEEKRKELLKDWNINNLLKKEGNKKL